MVDLVDEKVSSLKSIQNNVQKEAGSVDSQKTNQGDNAHHDPVRFGGNERFFWQF